MAGAGGEQRFEAMTLHSYKGGLLLDGNKQAADHPIIELPLPTTLVLPLVNYRREMLTPLARPGDWLAGGEAVAAGVLSGTSGTVIGIENRPFIHPSGSSVPCAIVETDGRDIIASLPPLISLVPERLLAAGIHGMGGAGYAAADKFRAIAEREVSLLIINGAECEPGIACDAALMQSNAPAVVEGIDQLVQLSRCRQCIIAVEESSVHAIASLRAALADRPLPTVELRVIPARYPSGAEATLVRLLSGIRLKTGERPTDHGMLCLNVATAFACGEAARGVPLHARLMTVGGDALSVSRNVRVRFGTPISHILEHVREEQASGSPLTGDDDVNGRAPVMLQAGGPLSGFALASAEAPVTATTHCVMLNSPAPAPIERECIRCGQCADVCPAELLPQQLHRHARNDNPEQLQRFSLSACIACGCCDLVCPSAIPLTALFRHAQSQLRERDCQANEANRLAALHEAREQRLQRQASERDAERARRREQLATRADKVDPVAAALARARARRAGSNGSGSAP